MSRPCRWLTSLTLTASAASGKLIPKLVGLTLGNNMKILLVLEEGQTAQYLRKGLQHHGFAVDVATPNARAFDARGRVGYDLLVCDVAAGGRGNFQLSREGPRPPVLFLTERSAAPRPAGSPPLENYLVKPLVFSDFLARVRRLIRWEPENSQMTLRIDDLEIDLVRHRATRAGKRLDLTPKEFLLLSLMMRRSGEVLSRALIADQVWEINFESNTNFVDVHIRRLRSKVDDEFPRKLIHTVRGAGYVVELR